MPGRLKSKVRADAPDPLDEDLEDDKVKLELKRFLLKVVREADKEYSIDHLCEKSKGYKHRVKFVVPDIASRLKAVDQLLDRLEGKPTTQKAPPAAPKYDVDSMDGLTDEQLDAIIAAGPGVSAADD
jgi:hypothetical protein